MVTLQGAGVHRADQARSPLVHRGFGSTRNPGHPAVSGKEIRTTKEHPFYESSESRWTPAGELPGGARLLSHDGQEPALEGREENGVYQTVYNLRVTDWHTYFVGGEDWEFSVWAHNARCTVVEYDGAHILMDSRGQVRYRGRSYNEVAEYAHEVGDTIIARRPTYRGGPHSMTSRPKNDLLDSHHIPADSVNGIPRDAGPAIQMDIIDHRLTSSHGAAGLGHVAYRAEIADLIAEGKFKEAMAKEIRDVRRAALEGSGDLRKYNRAILEMLEYARQAGFLN